MSSSVKFPKVPFGSTQPRFNLLGMHPAIITRSNFLKPHFTKLGPGKYHSEYDTISYRVNLKNKVFGSNWEKALQVETWKSIPHILCKKSYEDKELQRMSLGPTSYEKKDFLQLLKEKTSSPYGILDSKNKRLIHPKKEVQFTPGPGSYGFPEKQFREFLNSWHTKTEMLSSGPKNARRSLVVGSGVAPNTYNIIGGIDELLKKKVSPRGPYDCFTGSRWGRIVSGYYAQLDDGKRSHWKLQGQ